MSTTMLIARKVAQTKADKTEKTRQSLASLNITYIYQYILAGIIGVFILRHLALLLRDFLRARRRSLALKSTNAEKGLDLNASHESDAVAFKALGAIDRFFSKPVGVSPLPPTCTRLRLGLSTVICVVNLAFCLIVDTNLHSPATPNSNIPRAFVRRCGRICVANFPIIFSLVGRNNPVTFLTGLGYQEVRFYHRLIGGLVALESFVHTIGYVAYYVQFLGAEALYEEYEELYLKMGIVAQVGFLMLVAFSVALLRHRYYEIMLLLHVVGAAMVLAGAWYHRPIIVNWVYAAVAIWAFERLARLVRHVSTIFGRRFFVRSPILRAEATVVSGAILLRIPFPVGKWEASQHAFISFWGTDLLSKPWLYGQSHPFSICNIPQAEGDDHELRFVMRIKKGITRTLADHIQAGQKNGQPATKMIRISAEGPYGHAAADNDFESVLLVAGGSGITHVSSALADVVQKVAAGKHFARTVKLVWAVHHFSQTQWLGPILEEVRSTADKTNLDLQLHIYVTRPAARDDDSVNGESQSSSPGTSTPSSFTDEEKKVSLADSLNTEATRMVVHVGRPDVADIVSQTISQSHGRVRIVACGPDAILDTVRLTTSEISSAAVDVEIASFEC